LKIKGLRAFLILGNLVDATAVAIPCGQFADGFPRSIQVLGPPNVESAVLEAAIRIEESARLTDEGGAR
jgi:Asp-tRNA(Asn)/Glu-tRNA(Gln) amidotransferase A subunit family amidase